MAITFIKLDVNILNDTKIKIIRKMPDGDKLITLWIGILCIGMKSSTPGLLEIGEGIAFDIDGLSAELDLPPTIVRYGLNQFEQLKMVENMDGVYFITNFEKHQNLEKINKLKELAKKRQAKHRAKIKSNALQIRDSRKSNAPDLDLDLYEDEDEDKTKKKKKKFVKPNIEEIKQYCDERKNSIDAEKFYYHYEANGWMRGKNKIKSWKACIITWEKNSTDKSEEIDCTDRTWNAK